MASSGTACGAISKLPFFGVGTVTKITVLEIILPLTIQRQDVSVNQIVLKSGQMFIRKNHALYRPQPGHTGHFTYKNDFTIDDDGVPICKLGLRMHKDGYSARIGRNTDVLKQTEIGCFCEHPCSPAKYGRTVHIFTDDNPRLFNIPPRDSKAWEKEYDGRTSVERSNKREKEDYKLEDGRHRSTKMWYCRLYGIMMLQHLDAWEMPSVEAFHESLLGFTA